MKVWSISFEKRTRYASNTADYFLIYFCTIRANVPVRLWALVGVKGWATQQQAATGVETERARPADANNPTQHKTNSPNKKTRHLSPIDDDVTMVSSINSLRSHCLVYLFP